MNINQIGQIAVHADDLNRAVAFYRDTLGMRFLFQVPPGLAFFDCGGIRLMLDAVVEKDTPERLSSLIYYKVSDLDATYQTLLSRGVSFDSKPHLIAKMPDHELWMAFFRDSEKNLVGLMSEVREAK
jgi:predicted enzyme related to lactoylglutathione lyase